MLGGGVGRDSGDGVWKKESLSELADFGGAAEERRGVVSVSSSGRSREEGCEELDETDDERVRGGGG